VRHVARELLGKLAFVVCVDLCIVASPRNGHVRQPAIDELFSCLFGVHVDKHAVGGLSLAAVARHCIAVEKPKPLTVKEACDKFVADSEARNLREPTLYKYRLLFHQLQDFATLNGLPYINNFTIDDARRFRATWPNRNIAARKKLEAFRAFFRFVHESAWIPTNPTTPLKPPRITEPPTAPFTREEIACIVKACDIYPDKANAVRLRALVLLLRYSGLRIRDAATLGRNRIQDDKLFLYTAKTGTPVYCPLPPCVVEALSTIPESTYFFWTRFSTPKTAAGKLAEQFEAPVYLGRHT
jgi:integrase/recombinase XerD